ncbi:hypothetical protein [Microbacterium sp.]|uniref:hypothetical protein n=1 Tax=Microbacterium sp. TaxID=51671 RepID=UPI002E379161|nr:hypothetical protein [Microbacterium sp.]HEX5730610.1 hypothetical protein [Microbacterium sp.]
MSTPEQPATPALTRKQLRDIRNTGSTPIVTGDEPADAQEASSETAPDAAPGAGSEAAPTPESVDSSAPAHAAAPLPRAAEPVAVHDLPGSDASVDLGVQPLTRRQARQQERIRTASVPVITPEVAAAHAASVAAASRDESEAPVDDVSEDATSGSVSLAEIFGVEPTEPHAEVAEDRPADVRAEATEAENVEPLEELVAEDSADAEEPDRAVVNPQFGADLLAGEPVQAALPPSFDQLISRSMNGSVGTGNALILSQTPSAPPLSAPVTATGEVIITGTYNLPDGLGSTGHANGTADGKEVDAVLVDGELPAHSSPTPIAASAAISTVKNGGDIIQPPTPEKGGRLMLTLAITAGVLALALVGVLILAFVTGVF